MKKTHICMLLLTAMIFCGCNKTQTRQTVSSNKQSADSNSVCARIDEQVKEQLKRDPITLDLDKKISEQEQLLAGIRATRGENDPQIRQVQDLISEFKEEKQKRKEQITDQTRKALEKKPSNKTDPNSRPAGDPIVLHLTKQKQKLELELEKYSSMHDQNSQKSQQQLREQINTVKQEIQQREMQVADQARNAAENKQPFSDLNSHSKIGNQKSKIDASNSLPAGQSEPNSQSLLATASRVVAAVKANSQTELATLIPDSGILSALAGYQKEWDFSSIDHDAVYRKNDMLIVSLWPLRHKTAKYPDEELRIGWRSCQAGLVGSYIFIETGSIGGRDQTGYNRLNSSAANTEKNLKPDPNQQPVSSPNSQSKIGNPKSKIDAPNSLPARQRKNSP
jgi:hypothetical protein